MKQRPLITESKEFKEFCEEFKDENNPLKKYTKVSEEEKNKRSNNALRVVNKSAILFVYTDSAENTTIEMFDIDGNEIKEKTVKFRARLERVDGPNPNRIKIWSDSHLFKQLGFVFDDNNECEVTSRMLAIASAIFHDIGIYVWFTSSSNKDNFEEDEKILRTRISCHVPFTEWGVGGFTDKEREEYENDNNVFTETRENPNGVFSGFDEVLILHNERRTAIIDSALKKE